MKEKLALAIGYLFGDGGISKDGRVHYCNSEKFLINEFIISMGIFNIKPYLREEEGIFRVRYPVSVGNKLKGLFGEFSSGKDTKKITKEIFNMPLNWKIKMLRSWFNDDGSVVNSSPNYKVIAIKQKLENLIVFIRDTLKEIGIESHLHNEGKIWCLRIFGYKNIKKFKEIVNFSEGYRKSQQLEEMYNSIKRPFLMTKFKIIDLLKESPKTIKELANFLNLEYGTVYGHIYGWRRKKRKSCPGLVDLESVRKLGNKFEVISSASTSASCG